jgi:DNA replication protein DnaC
MDESLTPETETGLRSLKAGGIWARYQEQIQAGRAAAGRDSLSGEPYVIAEQAPVEPPAVGEFKGYAALRYADQAKCETCRDTQYVTAGALGPAQIGRVETKLIPCPSCSGGQVEDDRGLVAMGADPTKTIESFDFARNPGMREAWSLLEEVIAGRRWVVFMRSWTGTGKTHLSNAALIKWSRTWQSHKGSIIPVPDMVDQFRACEREGAAMRGDDLLKWYRELEFLVLDDLGAQRPKDYADEKLYAVIDSRLRTKRRTVLSANVMPGTAEEAERIEPRILSRISAGEIQCKDLVDQRKELEL